MPRYLIRAELAWREGHLADAAGCARTFSAQEAGKPASWASLRAQAGARFGVLKLEAGDIARGTALLRDALSAVATVGDRSAAVAAVEGFSAAALRIAGAGRRAWARSRARRQQSEQELRP